MHKDKRALVETLRHYKRHILGPLFTEAADTIEAMLNERTAEKEPGHWIFLPVESDPKDPAGIFRHRYQCSKCGEWQSYGMTRFCPNCGKPMQKAPEAHDCHNCKHKDREDVRECQKCLDAGDFPLWEDENG